MRETIEHGVMLLIAGVLGFICVLTFGFWIGSVIGLVCSCVVGIVCLKIFSVLETRRATIKPSHNDRRHHE